MFRNEAKEWSIRMKHKEWSIKKKVNSLKPQI